MPAAAVRHDVTTYEGNTEVIETDVVDAGVQVDLTGASAVYRVARTQGGAQVASVACAVSTVVTVVITPTLTGTTLGPGRWWHEKVLTEDGGRVTTIMHGWLIIQPKVA